MAICALPVVPAPPTTMPMMPFESDVAAMTALDGLPVSFASLLAVVPVALAFAISKSNAFDDPTLRLPPSAPEIVGVVSVGLLAKTTLPLPVVPLDRSPAAGWLADGTPAVEILLIHLFACAAND